MVPVSFRSCLAALLTIFGCILLFASGATAQDWRQYRNERYGFTLDYPADLLVTERAAEAGDGHVFASSDDEARLLVGALPNDSGYTPATYQQYIARHSYPSYQIDYRRLSSSWFALSGEGEGRIFYEKVMFTCGGRLMTSFAMIYPSARLYEPRRGGLGLNQFRANGAGCSATGPCRTRADGSRAPRYTSPGAAISDVGRTGLPRARPPCEQANMAHAIKLLGSEERVRAILAAGTLRLPGPERVPSVRQPHRS